jgi:NarL family two-component system sensor histidine kinase LiaS
MLVTVAALLAVEIALFAFVLLMLSTNLLPTLMVQAFEQQFASRVTLYLDQQPPDLEGLDDFLSAYVDQPVGGNAGGAPGGVGADPVSRSDNFQSLQSDGAFTVIDQRGRVIWSAETAAGRVPVGEPYNSNGDAGLDQVITAALAGVEDTDRLFTRTPDSMLVVAVPLRGQSGRILGAMMFSMYVPTLASGDFLLQLLPTLGISLLLFTLLAGGAGTLFGFFNARRLTRRLDRIVHAAGAWSQGDFSTFIQDGSHDELGDLARRLNGMAGQLQSLFHTRQELATLEERNRIARELHDSVKQQVFATGMQLGAARALLPDEGPAGDRLEEAERLIHLAQAELTHLIQELRPLALERKGLARAMKEMAGDWERQSGIKLTFDLVNEPVLPVMKEQVVYRVAQEALTNAARHSQAQNVTLRLSTEDRRVTLEVVDDGNGFDLGETGTGLGLHSMHERVAAVDGRLVIESRPQHGTRIVMTLPVD